MKRPVAIVVSIGLLGFALACARAEDAPADHAVSVRTARVESGTITEWIRMYGRIAPPPDRDATLAPLVAGLLLAVPVREGQSVRAGTPATPVIQVASATGAQVGAEATADPLSRLAQDQPAEVEARGSPGAAVRAHVLRIARAVDSSTGSGEVRLAFDDAAPPLPLGLGVDVRVAVGRRERATIVPAKALRRGDAGKTEVVVIDQGKAVIRRVVAGLTEGDRVEVVSGLSADETVVVDDPMGLADGTVLRERS